MTVAILANSRTIAPAGIQGGGDGLPGRAWIEKADGRRHEMSGTDRVEVDSGDRLVLQTPGGAGYGSG